MWNRQRRIYVCSKACIQKVKKVIGRVNKEKHVIRMKFIKKRKAVQKVNI